MGNRHSPITIVAAITSRLDDRLYPTEVALIPPEGGLRESSVVLLNQIRSVDKRRLTAKLGRISKESMERVDRALIVSLGFVEL